MTRTLLVALALSLTACGSAADAEPLDDTAPTSSDAQPADDAGDTGMVSEDDAPSTDSAASDDVEDTAIADATDASEASAAKLPSEVLDLRNWKLTLPIDTDHAGSPDEIKQPELAGFVHPEYFRLTDDKSAVRFRAHCGGATTSGSGYPRSELREMTNDGKTNAAWSPSSGTHKMIVREAITHLPVAKPDVVAAQIHDSEDDVIEIRLRDKHLFVEHDGANYGTLDAAYALGTVFTVEIRVTAGKLEVFYNGVRKVERATSGSGYYFKAGAYTQSNPSKGDEKTAYGEVVIHDLRVTHE